MISNKERGDKYFKRVQDKGKNEILTFNGISSLKLKKRQSLLDSILDSKQGAFKEQGKPIIIVPASYMQGNLCLHNSLSFLKNQKYLDNDGTSGMSDSERYKQNVEFTSYVNGKEVTFEVYDSVINFTKDHWRRACAVFVSGQEW